MSAEATGWVWKHSPYKGAELLVHLAIADVVNDVNDNEFWMSGANLAEKAKVSRSTVVSTLRDLVELGLMELVESRAQIRQPSRFRFLMPASAVSALAPHDTGATSAHVASAAGALADVGTSADTARSRALSPHEHARPPRANPKEITQENKTAFSTAEDQEPQCPQCHGTGFMFTGTPAGDVPCDCSDLDRLRATAAPPPWVALRMTRKAWLEAGCPERTLEVVP